MASINLNRRKRKRSKEKATHPGCKRNEI
jgi:hypothetical protein